MPTDRELLDELKKKVAAHFNVNVYEGEFVLRAGEISHFYFEDEMT